MSCSSVAALISSAERVEEAFTDAFCHIRHQTTRRGVAVMSTYPELRDHRGSDVAETGDAASSVAENGGEQEIGV